MNKKMVSAPGKLMLMGEHAVVYDHPCLVTAVDQRMWVTIELMDNQEFWLEAKDVGIKEHKKTLKDLGKGGIPKGAKFVELAVKNIIEKYSLKSGFKVVTKSEFSSEFGFGSSSASTVCTIKAISEIFKLNLSHKEIFDISYKTVLDIQGKGSGFDVAASVYGGTLYFLTGGRAIKPFGIKSLPLVVGYSGVKADTAQLINKVKEDYFTKKDRLDEIYNKIEVLVNQGKDALVKRDWKALGKLMNKNQEYLVELGVSSGMLDKMIEAVLQAEAYGAKLSGAGGGDCMIAIVSEGKKEAVKRAILSTGGTIVNVETDAEGVKVE
ncbi:MAG: mevalonate kinase [Candidatus Levybacteria bacterium RIFCSPHIGHO2_01_FULL_38_26]|nr:MAG: mevalonate kinase [Candidatus Levybacteria bacterium RIFCSPHIGHO2_01_FULL_38_26]